MGYNRGVQERANDEVLDALDDLVDALTANSERNRIALERADAIRAARKAGRSYSEIVSDQARPLIVDVLNQNLDRLVTSGARFRRAEAKALHDEGVTMERIAEIFGVTRQRVSALLKTAQANGNVN
jgi:hypothetical protein